MSITATTRKRLRQWAKPYQPSESQFAELVRIVGDALTGVVGALDLVEADYAVEVFEDGDSVQGKYDADTSTLYWPTNAGLVDLAVYIAAREQADKYGATTIVFSDAADEG